MSRTSVSSVLTGFLMPPLVVTGLVACGGGGGTSNIRELAVDADSARTLVGGETLTMTPAEIRNRYGELIRTSDSLLLSDIPLFIDEGAPDRLQTRCSGPRCTLTGPASSDIIGLSDFSNDADYEPVMADRGVSLAQGTARLSDQVEDSEIEGEELGYGGWMDYSGFGIEWASFSIDDIPVDAVLSYSVGQATGTNPVSGAASWTGVMVGADVSALTTRGHVIQGDAEITVDFSNTNVDVAFTNIYDLDAGTLHGDMEWSGIPMANGAFGAGSDGNSIEGRFHGPAHEEVGGIFERNLILGAFGARREQ